MVRSLESSYFSMLLCQAQLSRYTACVWNRISHSCNKLARQALTIYFTPGLAFFVWKNPPEFCNIPLQRDVLGKTPKAAQAAVGREAEGGDRRYSVGGIEFEQLGDIQEGTKTRALNHSELHSSTLWAVIGVSSLDHKTPDPIKPVLVQWMAWQIETLQMDANGTWSHGLWMTILPAWCSSCWRHHGQVADEGDSLRPWTGAAQILRV